MYISNDSGINATSCRGYSAYRRHGTTACSRHLAIILSIPSVAFGACPSMAIFWNSCFNGGEEGEKLQLVMNHETGSLDKTNVTLPAITSGNLTLGCAINKRDASGS